MKPLLLEPPVKLWDCPACGAEHETREARPHVPMHDCRAMRGCSVPFVERGGPRSRVRLVEREDYVGDELVRTDADGRPIMAAVVERSDGSNDCFAFAPTAWAGAGATGGMADRL